MPYALGFLLVASYSSQDYGGGIRTRLQAGTLYQIQSYFTNVIVDMFTGRCLAMDVFNRSATPLSAVMSQYVTK
jgi:hypothetical protein